MLISRRLDHIGELSFLIILIANCVLNFLGQVAAKKKCYKESPGDAGRTTPGHL